jgi:hypothetical protein
MRRSTGIAGFHPSQKLSFIAAVVDQGMPSSVTITLGTVDDSSLNGGHTDQSPTVTGYGL